MGSKTPSYLIRAVLTVILWENLIADAGQFRRVPKDGDSCRGVRFVGNTNGYDYMLRTLGLGFSICPEGTVVSSYGDCVDPGSFQADRCQEMDGFSQAKVNAICRLKSDAIFADPFDCSGYYNCSAYVPNRHVRCGYDTLTQSLLYYDDVNKVCRPVTDVMCGQRPVNYTAEQLEAICRAHRTRVFPNTDNCNSYYNCSEPRDQSVSITVFRPFHAECPYLQLFDVETKSCKPFGLTPCGLRKEIKKPCELQQYQCRTGHCRPCVVDNPDCTHLPDGRQPIPYQHFTPRYVQCLEGRTLGVGTCQSAPRRNGFVEPRLFHPETKRCEFISSIPRSLGGWGPDS